MIPVVFLPLGKYYSNVILLFFILFYFYLRKTNFIESLKKITFLLKKYFVSIKINEIGDSISNSKILDLYLYYFAFLIINIKIISKSNR